MKMRMFPNTTYIYVDTNPEPRPGQELSNWLVFQTEKVCTGSVLKLTKRVAVRWHFLLGFPLDQFGRRRRRVIRVVVVVVVSPLLHVVVVVLSDDDGAVQ